MLKRLTGEKKRQKCFGSLVLWELRYHWELDLEIYLVDCLARIRVGKLEARGSFFD